MIAVVLSGIFHDYNGFGGGSSSASAVRGEEHRFGRGGGGGEEWRVVFRLYRGPLLFILFIFLMGINVYGWR